MAQRSKGSGRRSRRVQRTPEIPTPLSTAPLSVSDKTLLELVFRQRGVPFSVTYFDERDARHYLVRTYGSCYTLELTENVIGQKDLLIRFLFDKEGTLIGQGAY